MSDEPLLVRNTEVSAVLDNIEERVRQTSAGRTVYGYGSNVLGDSEEHLVDYLKVLYKRRWAAASTFTAIVLAVCTYTFTVTPVYEARTQILIEKENTNVVTFKEAFEQNQIADDYYQTQYKILQSRAIALRTINQLKLKDNPRFHSGSQPRRSWVSKVTGFLKQVPAPEPRLPDETKVQSALIDQLLAGVTIVPVRASRLVDVKYESVDPNLSAQVVNTLANEYIQQNLEFKFLASKEASDWLRQRLDEQRKQVEASEQALQRYREQTDSVSLEDKQNIVVQKLAELNTAVTRIKTERIQKETAYNQIRALQRARASLDSLPAIVTNAFIQQQKGQLADLQRQQAQLSDKLGPRHPDMVKIGLAISTAEAKIQGEIDKIVQAMANDYQQAVSQEKSLMNALEQQKEDALALNRKGIDYSVLARDAASNRQIFDSLMQRSKETGISGELKSSNIRIVDAAEVPRRPIRPDTSTNLLLAFFGGGTFGIALAFFLEYLDNRIKNPDEVRQHLGLPFIGMIPALFGNGHESRLINNGVPNNFLESIRAVRTNVLFSLAHNGGHSLVVTSTGPGEGKTVVACNLAIALAQSGQRVLLMDADMRKPRVHKLFDSKQEPGLSNVLVGKNKPSDAVRESSVPGLWILPSGVMPPDPAKLLGSNRFRELVSLASKHFDWIVLDTPPVMAVTDSAVAAHEASGVLFVIGAEMTSRQSASRALDQLIKAKAKMLGAILNRVDLKHHGYYYSQYYHHEYAAYYGNSHSNEANLQA